MAPIILSAGLLSFIRAMDAFEVPVLLGLPAKVMVFSNRIYAAVEYDYPVNYGLATALGVSFVALMLILIYFQIDCCAAAIIRWSRVRATNPASFGWVAFATSRWRFACSISASRPSCRCHRSSSGRS
jgi:ABC-type Fe3+ transport system permease subunit